MSIGAVMCVARASALARSIRLTCPPCINLIGYRQTDRQAGGHGDGAKNKREKMKDTKNKSENENERMEQERREKMSAE